jgi:hypothetical protein
MARAGLAAAAAGYAVTSAAASPGTPGHVEVGLTEAAAPDSPAWQEPARISLTIDPHGPDKFSAQINLDLGWQMQRASLRGTSAGGTLVWNRETGSDDRQNNLEVGGYYAIDYNPNAHLDRHPGLTPDQQASFVDFSSRFSLKYARTADYPDLESAVCVAQPALRQCQTQFKESFRASAAFNMFNNGLERDAGPFSYSITPQAGLDYDHLLNSPINTKTGLEATGGYLSAKAALGVLLVPTFLHPQFELRSSVQLRQRIFASDSRRSGIRNSAVLFEGSATYFFVPDTDDSDWRAGIGITYTRGDDPLNGRSNENRIVIALRIGRY